MNLSGSKKGGIMDSYMVIPIFLFTFGFTVIVGFVIWLSLISGFTTAGIYTGAAATAGDGFTNAFKIYDTITVIIMAVMVIGIGITSYRIKTPTIYFIIMLALAIFLGIVSYFFNYIFAQIVSQTVFDTARVFFAKTIFICTNMHWVSLLAIIVGSLLTYSKNVEDE